MRNHVFGVVVVVVVDDVDVGVVDHVSLDA